MSIVLNIHEIKLTSKTPFTEQFNRCSDLFQKFNDDSLSKEEQEENFQAWLDERYRLETGSY